MEPIRKAVWYIESHSAEPIALDEIAHASGLSRFHLCRTFGHVTGTTISSYLRRRRLSAAALRLVAGAPDILSVAIDAGYGSHEAFTRAFRDLFGATPEEVRARRNAETLDLQEPYTMTKQATVNLPEPAFTDEGPFLFAGIRAFFSYEERGNLPGLWQRLAPYLGNISNQIGPDAYGLCLAPSSGAEGFDYMPAVAVRTLDDMPEGMTGIRIARRRYAKFPHKDHVGTIGATYAAAMGEWQPKSGIEVEHEPVFMVEHYDGTFNRQTGNGGMEVWVPVKA